MQALVKDKKRKLLHKKLSENIGKPKIGSIQQKASHNKHMPQYEKEKSWYFLPGQSQTLLKHNWSC